MRTTLRIPRIFTVNKELSGISACKLRLLPIRAQWKVSLTENTEIENSRENQKIG